VLPQDEETPLAVGTEPTPAITPGSGPDGSQCGHSEMCSGAGLSLPLSKPLTNTTSVQSWIQQVLEERLQIRPKTLG